VRGATFSSASVSIFVSADENADKLSAARSFTTQEIQPTADIADDSEKEAKKTLVQKSSDLVKELQRLCYPFMTKDEYRDRFRNLFQARYGVKVRSQMNIGQLQDFIDFLTYWLRTGAKFQPQEWALE